jgi:hypothetical protein
MDFGSFEKNAWAFAGAVIAGAVIIGILRNPRGITAAGGAFFGGLRDVSEPFLRA